jgi:hypothetical protein
MRIDSSGNVGIGTSSPTGKLHISGGVNTYQRISNATNAVNIDLVAGASIGYVGTNTNHSLALITNDTERMRIDTSGNVGIGTTSPAALLSFGSFASGASDGARIYLRGNTNEFAIGVNGSQNVYAGFAGHVWQTGSFGGTERMRIDSSGNLLVGSTLNFSSLGKSIAVAESIGNAGIQIDAVTGAGYSARIYNGNPNVTFDNNSSIRDYVFVKNTGASYATVTAVINNVSDYRLKENITPLTGAIDRINALKPIQYSFKSDVKPAMSWGTAEVDGFLAHEFGEVIVGGCNGEKDAIDEEGNIKPQGVDMTRAIPLLVAAIQEQQVMIEELNAKVDAQATTIAKQQALITNLTTRLTALEAK